MSDNKNFIVDIEGEGNVNITEEVIVIVAGLGALEVDGVSSLAGNLTQDMVPKAGMNKLSKAIRIVETGEGQQIAIRIALNMGYGYEIPKVCSQVQDKVKSAVETMTGLEVTAVDIRIASVSMS